MRKVHESPMVMLLPLVVLGAGALFAGAIFSGAFVGDGYDSFWDGAIFLLGPNVLDAVHHISWGNIAGKWGPTIVMLVGFALAYWFYIKDTSAPARWAKAAKPVYDGYIKRAGSLGERLIGEARKLE